MKYNIFHYSATWKEYKGATELNIIGAVATFMCYGRRHYISGNWYAEEVTD